MKRSDLVARNRKPPVSAPEPFTEKHYRVEELAQMWNLSRSQIRKMFRGVAGVAMVGNPEGTSSKRPYVTMLIPASVAERVYSTLTRAS